MYRVLLRDGHQPPEIFTEGADVVCRLPGGAVDAEVRGFFDNLYTVDRDLEEDVRVHLAITSLLTQPNLRVEGLADVAQCSQGEALEEFECLAKAGVVERLVNGSLTFRLTESARAALRHRILHKGRNSLDDKWDSIRAFLDTHDSIGRTEAAEVLRIGATDASLTLSRLYNLRGYLEPVGNSRGRGVRYRLSVADRSGNEQGR
jgi:hypothetical protein